MARLHRFCVIAVTDLDAHARGNQFAAGPSIGIDLPHGLAGTCSRGTLEGQWVRPDRDDHRPSSATEQDPLCGYAGTGSSLPVRERVRAASDVEPRAGLLTKRWRSDRGAGTLARAGTAPDRAGLGPLHSEPRRTSNRAARMVRQCHALIAPGHH